MKMSKGRYNAVLSVILISVFTFFIITTYIFHFFPSNFSLMVLLTVSAILLLLNVFPYFKDYWVDDKYQHILLCVFLSIICLTIAFSIALWNRLVPDYFNSFYILLGSLLVTILALILSRGLDKQKEDKKIERTISLVTYTIKFNEKTIKRLLNLFQDEYYRMVINDSLETNFLDILSSNVIDIDLDVLTLYKFTDIEKLTLEINQLIEKRNILCRALPGGCSSFDSFPKLYKHNKPLKDKLEILLEKSSEIRKINYRLNL